CARDSLGRSPYDYW
nr:immunoglobulin heavy chain junction region [Macaca mulatta]